MGYEESYRERKTAFKGDPAYITLMGERTRKGFKTAAYYFGISIAIFFVDFLMSGANLAPEAHKMADAFRLVAIALIGSSALTLLSLLFAQGLLPFVLIGINWIILPLVLLDAILTIWGIFVIKEMPTI